MAQYPILKSLRLHTDESSIDLVASPSGYRLPKVIADRIKLLKETKQLDKAALMDEVSAIVELALDVQGEFEFILRNPEPIKIAVKRDTQSTPKFTAKFLEFLATGDFAPLQDAHGSMSPETYRSTRDFIFCHVKKVVGTSVIADFHSNRMKQCSGVIQPGVEIKEGPMVIFNRKGVIYDAVEVGDNFEMLARAFNALAAKSKPNRT